MASKDLSRVKGTIYFCNGEACLRAGAESLTEAIRARIHHNHWDSKMHTVKTRCAGFCEEAPVVVLQPQNAWYGHVDVQSGCRILTQHLMGGKLIWEKLFFPPSGENHDRE